MRETSLLEDKGYKTVRDAVIAYLQRRYIKEREQESVGNKNQRVIEKSRRQKIRTRRKN